LTLIDRSLLYISWPMFCFLITRIMSALDAFIFIFIFEDLMHWLEKICQFISLGFTNTHIHDTSLFFKDCIITELQFIYGLALTKNNHLNNKFL